MRGPRWAAWAALSVACARAPEAREPAGAPETTGAGASAEVIQPSVPAEVPESATPAEASAPIVPPDPPRVPRWVAYGGVDSPASNQLSIEDELLMVQDLLGPGEGVMLYAGGAGTRGVQVTTPSTPTLLTRLGAILDPRAGRDARYDRLRVVPHEPGTREALLQVLGRALDEPGPRLTLWLAGHGVEGSEPAEVGLSAWGTDTVLPEDLHDLLVRPGAPRKLRVISTTCYGGGFADALRDLPTRACGAFAAHWSTPASGCDPDPDAPRTSYGVHLAAALAGKVKVDDLDQNGVIGLSEAHVYAALALAGIDKPVLSSQHLIDHLVEGDPPRPEVYPAELVEELALKRALYERLGLDDDTLEATRAELDAAWEPIERDHEQAQRIEADALVALRGALLARWPELEDPWRPDFQAVLTREAAAIERFLDASPEHALWLEEARALDASQAEVDAYNQRRSAHELVWITELSLRGAALLRADETSWRQLWELRACEREPLR